MSSKENRNTNSHTTTEVSIETRFNSFIKELEEISNKYKIGIDACGGVSIYETDTQREIIYDRDYTSGDINHDLH